LIFFSSRFFPLKNLSLVVCFPGEKHSAKMILRFAFFILQFVPLFLSAQNEARDKEKAEALLHTGETCYLDKPDSAVFYWENAKSICLKYIGKCGHVTNKDTLSSCYFFTEIYANTLNDLGYIAKMKGNITLAISDFFEAQKIFEQISDRETAAHCLSNIGAVYVMQGDLNKALDCFMKSAETLKAIKIKDALSTIYNHIASIYQDTKQIELADEYYQKALVMSRELNDKLQEANTLNNLGDFNLLRHNYEKSRDYFLQAIKLQEEGNDKRGAAIACANVARIYVDMYISKGRHRTDLQKALDYTQKSLKAGRELGYPEIILSAARISYDTYKFLGDDRKALEYYEEFIKMRDSVSNESNRKASIRQMLKHEYEKKAAADSVSHAKESEIKSAELSRQSAEIKAKKNQQYALFGGLFLVILFSIFMYNRFKVTQKQKAVIEQQKEVVEDQKKLVEEKQREILDSIRYAKKIQLAQIPSEKRISGMINRMMEA
jgi:tetratricopeptide (TPR) repeat protein